MAAELFEFSRATVSRTMKEFLKEGKTPINHKKSSRPRTLIDILS